MQTRKLPATNGLVRNVSDGTCFHLHPFRVNAFGRASHADIRLAGKQYSRIHAVIFWDGRAWILVDCSSNGTSVNGRPIHRHSLISGDRIRFTSGADWIYDEVTVTPVSASESMFATGVPSIDFETFSNLASPQFIGDSDHARQLRDEIGRLAAAPTNVLLIGEFGVGKKTFARALHRSGSSAARAFVRVNCNALTGEDVRTTLTDLCLPTSSEQSPPPGTILLERIDELAIDVQKVLLELLESLAENYRFGDDATGRPRFVSTASSDSMISERISEPLARRMFVAQCVILPLRERTLEIPSLANHFVREIAEQLGRRSYRLSPGVLAKLEQYHWPANVAELRNAVERTVMLGQTENLEVWDLSSGITSETVQESVYSGLSLAEVENKHIAMTLKELQFKKSHAARILGIERSTLDRKIEKYGLSKEALGLHPRR